MIKLKPRLVPKPIWGVCLRNSVKKSQWDKISKAARKAAKHKCEICGSDGTSAVPIYSTWELCCDEVWEYVKKENGEPPEAKLVDLMSICYWCNAIVHYGFTKSTCSKEIQEKAFEHALKVNSISSDEMNSIIKSAFEEWRNLSSLDGWQVGWSNWKDIAKEKGIDIK